GRRMSTLAAAHAPRCLYRKPSCVASAQAKASRIPRLSVTKVRLSPEAVKVGPACSGRPTPLIGPQAPHLEPDWIRLASRPPHFREPARQPCIARVPGLLRA